MASLGHVAVGLAAARASGGPRLGRRMVAFGVLSLLPDVDVIGYALGVPYASTFGHRGATHSIAAAVVVALLAALVASPRARARVFVFVLLVMGSHGALDAMTDGGQGVALLWPVTRARYFFPWRPIPVAPLGVRVLSASGLHAMLFELAAFAPFWMYAFVPRRRSEAGRPLE